MPAEPKHSASTRDWKSSRKKQLGITDEEYARLFAAQNGVCAICGNPPKKRALHVDHDHRTGTVRGLLCFRCNRALPTWVNIPWLVGAADYLARAARAGMPPPGHDAS